MPITAKLSRRFYEKLGDDVANELAEWLNSVDASYHELLRVLFDANFGRIEAEMRALKADIRSEIAALRSELLKWMLLFWLGTIGTVLAILKF
ncbi:MAG TPA: hypothetical protein VGI92_07490 [Gemmatimonadales bacterium]